MQNSRENVVEMVGIYDANGKLVDSIEIGFVYGEENGNSILLPDGRTVMYVDEGKRGIFYLVLVKSDSYENEEFDSDENHQEMNELEKHVNDDLGISGNRNDPKDPDMWFPFARYCECEGFANKCTDGCKDKIDKVLEGIMIPLSPSNSFSSEPQVCCFGAKCHFLKTAKGCRNFHPENEKSDKPNRCNKGADCPRVKTGSCYFFHPLKEIPYCRFGRGCTKGTKCKFRH